MCLLYVITFRVSRRLREMYCGHAQLCVCLPVCLFLSLSYYCTDMDATWGSGRECLLVVHYWALLGGFAIDARVALLWQHNANAKC